MHREKSMENVKFMNKNAEERCKVEQNKLKWNAMQRGVVENHATHIHIHRTPIGFHIHIYASIHIRIQTAVLHLQLLRYCQCLGSRFVAHK